MRRNNSLSHMLLGAALTLGASQAMALQEMSDDSMSEIQGAGLAFAMDDFSIRFAPTSFIEVLGSAPTGQPAEEGWKRGDARYYGLSLTSGVDEGTDWYGNGCSGGPLACPIGKKAALGDTNPYGTVGFASVYDPFVLRVFEYEGFDYQGEWLGEAAPSGYGGTVGEMPTVLEFIGPSKTDPWRWAFWGELEVGRIPGADSADIGACNSSSAGCTSNGADFLQSQTIIHGKPFAKGYRWNETLQQYQVGETKPAILRLMRTANDSDPTLGITYQSALSGDFRFSVRQTDNSLDQLHWVPDFDDQEGMYFKNVDAYLPLGTLHYQAITFSGTSEYQVVGSPGNYEIVRDENNPVQNGNFTIELTRIPNDPNIYSHFYAGVTDGSCNLNNGSGDCDFASDGSIASPNPDTHGYVRWGNWFTTNEAGDVTGTIDPYSAPTGNGSNDLPTYNSTANGIYFTGSPVSVDHDQNPATPNIDTNTVNLGVSRIEGMTIHHMKITTLGAGL